MINLKKIITETLDSTKVFAILNSDKVNNKLGVLKNKTLTIDHLDHAMTDSDHRIRRAVIQHSGVQEHHLEMGLSDPNELVKLATARSSKLTPRLVGKVVDDSIKNNSHLIYELPLSKINDDHIRKYFVDSDHSSSLRFGTAKIVSRAQSKDLIDQLIYYPNEGVRMGVALSKHLSPEHVDALSKDPSSLVRENIASNKITNEVNPDVMHQLKDDPNSFVSKHALKGITRTFETSAQVNSVFKQYNNGYPSTEFENLHALVGNKVKHSKEALLAMADNATKITSTSNSSALYRSILSSPNADSDVVDKVVTNAAKPERYSHILTAIKANKNHNSKHFEKYVSSVGFLRTDDLAPISNSSKLTPDDIKKFANSSVTNLNIIAANSKHLSDSDAIKLAKSSDSRVSHTVTNNKHLSDELVHHLFFHVKPNFKNNRGDYHLNNLIKHPNAGKEIAEYVLDNKNKYSKSVVATARNAAIKKGVIS